MKSDLEKTLPTKPSEPPKIGLKAEPPVKKGKPKTILIIAGVIILGAAIVLLGYFVIFPMLFPPEVPPPAGELTPTLPIVPELPEVPAVTKPHQSILKIPADLQVPLSIPNLGLLQQALLSEAGSKPGNDILKEVLLSDTAGQIDFSSALPAFLPEFSKAELRNLFEEDFTTLIYYDANGAWPIFVSQLKSGASLSQAKAAITKIETANLNNLFLASPGTPTTFKNGQVGNLSTRYLTFSKPGAALNYGWLGNKLIISTSYNGLKKLVTKL